MTYNLVITADAEKDIIDACNYYEEQMDGLSDRFLMEINNAYGRILENPLYYSYISSKKKDKFRDIKINNFPFVIIFEIVRNAIIVNAVFNTNRRPKTLI